MAAHSHTYANTYLDCLMLDVAQVHSQRSQRCSAESASGRLVVFVIDGGVWGFYPPFLKKLDKIILLILFPNVCYILPVCCLKTLYIHFRLGTFIKKNST